MRIEKILVATDFGDASTEALDAARTIADACGASLQLLHVIDDPLAAPPTLDEERRIACARLETLLQAEDRRDRRASVACEVGTPAREIARYAGDHGVDLIVMGTHRHGSSHRMAAGSIAERVVGSAQCAVLAVKSAAEPPCDEWLDPPAAPLDRQDR
ncbi:MAG TPA: universal stress protein [Vicinamibacterales bacterium]|nr:universal stress protein [Vicinamibacterales bacterium]